jgi:cyclopropane fatty-acyl-phospholipid synthase-like methyltransferase
LANELCYRARLSDLVTVVPGDFADLSLDLGVPGDACADLLMSWLVVLHIPLPIRHEIFSRAFRLLKPGGMMYLEDFFQLTDAHGDRKTFSALEQAQLVNDISVPDAALPTREEYTRELAAAGFEVTFEDRTDDWTRFTKDRADSWLQCRERHVRVHSEEVWRSLNVFYSSMAEVFQGGNLGGVCLTLKKPLM